MFNRVFKSWKTSVLGVIILTFGLALIWTNKATILEALPFLTGLYGFFYKEKEEIKEKQKEIKQRHEKKVNDIIDADIDKLDDKLSEFRKRQRKD